MFNFKQHQMQRHERAMVLFMRKELVYLGTGQSQFVSRFLINFQHTNCIFICSAPNALPMTFTVTGIAYINQIVCSNMPSREHEVLVRCGDAEFMRTNCSGNKQKYARSIHLFDFNRITRTK